MDFSAGLTHAVRSAQPLDFLGGKMSAEIGIMDLNVIRVPKGELKKMVLHFRYRTVGNPGVGSGQFYVRGWSSVNKAYQSKNRKDEWRYAETP